MALSDIDRNLLERCLGHKPRAWEDFVDRFLGLVVHVINHSAGSRSIRLSKEDQEDLVAEVFLTIVRDDYAMLRRFRGQASLATYLTVVARRIAVRELLAHKNAARLEPAHTLETAAQDGQESPEQRMMDREEVERLLQELGGDEARVVRMYHLEGKSYHEISSETGMPENSVGPVLSRARQKLRQAGTEPTAS